MNGNDRPDMNDKQLQDNLGVILDSAFELYFETKDPMKREILIKRIRDAKEMGFKTPDKENAAKFLAIELGKLATDEMYMDRFLESAGAVAFLGYPDVAQSCMNEVFSECYIRHSKDDPHKLDETLDSLIGRIRVTNFGNNGAPFADYADSLKRKKDRVMQHAREHSGQEAP